MFKLTMECEGRITSHSIKFFLTNKIKSVILSKI